MELNQKIISKHIIMPSFPTPNRSKTYKLSYMDQIAAPMYGSLIFFYQNDESKPHIEISQLLKQSLSQALTVFYPFAGTIKENSFVDCNDTGVEFVEARVHARLAQVIEDPEIEDLKQFVPVDSFAHSDNAILLVKVNFFDCGGIAVGICLSHKVVDFASTVVFMNAWAAICRGETQVIQPLFDLAVHFPPKDQTSFYLLPYKEKITTKRLVFCREKLERLQQQVVSPEVKNPTMVEALSVFFWQQFIEATKAISGTKRSSFALEHAVNLRPRTIPPIPNHTIGNCSLSYLAFTSEPIDSRDLASKLRVAIRAIDNNYIQKLTNSEECLKTTYKRDELFKSGTKLLCISSLWKFPVYDVNFGWGKPVWVCHGAIHIENYVSFMSTPSGDGIEAWVNMSEDFLQKLETNYNNFFSKVTSIGSSKL